MNKLLAVLMLMVCFSSTGCGTLSQSFLEAAEEQARLKWAEEWRPALEEEIADAAERAEDRALEVMIAQLEKVEGNVDTRLTGIGIRLEDFDTNADGRVTGDESLVLLKEIRSKNENSPNPLQWYEIMAALAAAYLPLTAGKEMLRSKMNGQGTGDGNSQLA